MKKLFPPTLDTQNSPAAFKKTMAEFSQSQQQRDFIATALLRVDRFGYGLLHHAAASNASKTIEFMIWSAAAFNSQLQDSQMQQLVDLREPRKGFTPLLFGVMQSNHSAVQALVEKGHASINAPDFEGNSPLHVAVQNGDFKMVQLLLKYGASPNQCDVEGATPVHIAAANGNTRIAAALIAKGGSVHVQDNEGEVPLFYCVREGHQLMAQLLMRCGSDPRSCINEDNETPIDVALETGDADMAQLLATGQLPSSMLRPPPVFGGPAADTDAMDVDM
eukprot:TRINITY_DN4929_c0_g1_i2.p1 TRINITY_DN4929_c0_g1~~TRINITY_DN4929_c0_g1_i2.p1  ORF type:complete len:277 (-),score=56.99 TRINITY_DN4929_c0_g1_i2:54-884(-)